MPNHEHTTSDPSVDESRCIHTIEHAHHVEHQVVGPTEVPVLVEFIRANHTRWGSRPLLFDFGEAHLGETDYAHWMDARDDLLGIAHRRGGGRTALVSREPLHEGILTVFAHAARRADCPEHIRVFSSPVAATRWLSSDSSSDH